MLDILRLLPASLVKDNRFGSVRSNLTGLSSFIDTHCIQCTHDRESMANAGLGFIGFCLEVSWVILFLNVLWRVRLVYKDRFEYISVAYTPLKFAFLFFCTSWVFWWVAIGELWWFRDATDINISLLVTIFVDGVNRPVALALLCLLWSLPLSRFLPRRQGSANFEAAAETLLDGPPSGQQGTRHRYTPSNDSIGLNASGSDSDTGRMRNGALDAVGAPRRASTSLRVTFVDDSDATSRSGAAGAPLTPTDSTSTQYSPRHPPPARTSPSSSFSSSALAPAMLLVQYFGVARDFFIGEEEALTRDKPWELGARWRLSVQARWIVLAEIVHASLFLAMAVWQASRPLVSCGIIENPESGACFLEIAPNHLALVRPRVFTVLTLFVHSALFVALVKCGSLHLSRLQHSASRRRFRKTLALVLLFEWLCVFTIFCRIFDAVRFTPSMAFFLFAEDVFSQCLLWTMVCRMRTAANRRATGPVAATLRVVRDRVRETVVPLWQSFVVWCRARMKFMRKTSQSGEADANQRSAMTSFVLDDMSTDASRVQVAGQGTETSNVPSASLTSPADQNLLESRLALPAPSGNTSADDSGADDLAATLAEDFASTGRSSVPGAVLTATSAAGAERSRDHTEADHSEFTSSTRGSSPLPS